MRTAAFIVACAAAIAGCGGGAPEEVSTASDPGSQETDGADAGDPAKTAALELDRGDLQLIMQSAPQWVRTYEDGIRIQLEVLNDWVAFPEDISVTFVDCGVPNAFYCGYGCPGGAPGAALVMCRELFEDVDITAKTMTFASQEAAWAFDIGNLWFILYHELAHALIGELGLPATGGEEANADQFATVMLAGRPETAELALATPEYWMSKPAGHVPWDAHPYADQRFYAINCLVYGSDPQRFAYMVPTKVPEVRAPGCPIEWKKASEAWQELLSDYLL